MRTTLTIDDDLTRLLKQRARELGLPFKEVVNRTIRAGLGLGEQARPRRGAAPKTIPHSFGLRPGIDSDKLEQLADQASTPAISQISRHAASPTGLTDRRRLANVATGRGGPGAPFWELESTTNQEPGLNRQTAHDVRRADVATIPPDWMAESDRKDGLGEPRPGPCCGSAHPISGSS